MLFIEVSGLIIQGVGARMAVEVLVYESIVGGSAVIRTEKSYFFFDEFRVDLAFGLGWSWRSDRLFIFLI